MKIDLVLPNEIEITIHFRGKIYPRGDFGTLLTMFPTPDITGLILHYDPDIQPYDEIIAKTPELVTVWVVTNCWHKNDGKVSHFHIEVPGTPEERANFHWLRAKYKKLMEQIYG